MPKGQEKEPYKTPTSSGHDVSKDNRDFSSTISILDSHAIRTNPFGANITGNNSYIRAERILAAVHILTNHVPEAEPMRSDIRASGLELISAILDARTGMRSPGSEKGQMILSIIRRLISLLRTLSIAGYISAQNATTVIEALDELGSLIVVSHRSSLAEQFTISRADLMPPASPMVPPLAARPDRSLVGAPRTTASSSTGSAVPDSASSGHDAARSARILEILKVGGVLGIKDIASNLPQYSEKMIQRELAHLVHEGAVSKIGEKRWSRYQLVR